MKRAKILLFTLTSMALLGITVVLSSCCKSPVKPVCDQPECWTLGESFEKCNYLPSRPDTDDLNLRNMGKHFVVFGDSIAAGGWCYEEDQDGNPIRCGFREPLESRLQGNLVALFGSGGHTAENEVISGFENVNRSVDKNPDVKRVYLHIGGNDIKDWMLDHVAHMPLPSTDPEANCAMDTVLLGKIDQTVNTHVRQIVEQYIYVKSVPEVVVGSVHRLEINKPANALACYHLTCQKCLDYYGRDDCYLCMNDVLEVFSTMLSTLVDNLNDEYRTLHPGSPDVVFFADHFSGFAPTNYCEISCDCVHLNCIGHDDMAEIWWQARPVVPPIP